MKLKVAVILVLIVAIFPTLVSGVARDTVHAALQAVANLVGGPHG